MFSKKKSNTSSSQKVETVIGKNTSFQGELTVAGSIRIEGRIKGQLNVEGNVYVGREGRVEADISSSSIVIAGSVQADIVCQGRLEILPQGKLVGDIEIAQLVIQEGGTFIGQSKEFAAKDPGEKELSSQEDPKKQSPSSRSQQKQKKETNTERSQEKGKKSK